MIKLCRLDDRLIHGQIATKWSRWIGIDRIIVANDNAANSPVIRSTLLMAAPAQFKTTIKTIEDTVELMKNPKAANHDILLIVGNPADLLTIVEKVEGVKNVNLGNWGILEKNDGKERRQLTKFFHVSVDEADTLTKVANQVDKCVLQILPDTESINFLDII